MPQTLRDRPVLGWLMYDWANSAYVLTVATAVLPSYFAAAVVPQGGLEAAGTRLSATALWGWSVSLAETLVLCCSPILGAMADASGSKKRYLGAFCLAGSLAAMLLGTRGPGEVWTTLLLFIAAQFAFSGSLVFYDAFLPELALPGLRDRISGKGYAYGYVGGGLQFALCLGMVAGHEALGVTEAEAARLSMSFAGLWWALFAIPALRWIPERPSPTRPPLSTLARRSVQETWRTIRLLANDPKIFPFLLAYFCYNDGIQTFIAMAAIYGKEELGLSQSLLMSALLLVQALAMAGSMVFARLAEAIGTRTSLSLSLAVWIAISAWAFFIRTGTEYVLLAGAVGLVLGASQSLSRSLYASLIPPQAPAQYFGFFSVATKCSAILGPLVFATVRQTTGSSRHAVPVLALLFGAGLILLHRVKKSPGAVEG